MSGYEVYAKNYPRWRDLPDKTTPLGAAQLDHIEAGLLEASTELVNKAPLASPPLTGAPTVNGKSIVVTDDSRLSNARPPTAHTHAIADTTGLTAALAGKQDTSARGVANGYVPLNESAQIAAVYMPSYVDDVLEFDSVSLFPAVGEKGKIYTDTATNKTHRWGGSAYIEISPSPGSTDAVPEGAANLYFTAARAVAALSTALALLAPKASPTFTGTVKGLPYPVCFVSALGTRAVGSGEVPGGMIVMDPFTLTEIAYSFDTADTSGSTTVELRKNGAAVPGTSLAVTAANQAPGGGTLGARTVSGLAVAFAKGDVLCPQITGIGGTPGKGLTANIRGVTS